MKTTKEFPATHSMGTEWFITDAEGNIALFDFDDDGPVPATIADNDDFWGGLDEIGVPDKDGISSFELTDEQANYMLKQFKPISDFSEDNEYNCLVKIKDDEESLKTFISTFNDDIECCLSHKQRIYYVGWFWHYDATSELKKKRIALVKDICTGFLQEYFTSEFLSDKSVLPFYCYTQDYNLLQRTAAPKYPLKENQIPEENRKKLIHLSVKFTDCKELQIAEYVLCKNYSGDYVDKDGKTPITLPTEDD